MVDGFARNIKHTSEGIIAGRKMENMKSVIRLRMSAHDAHYGGNLVDGARMLGLFGDVATELLILNDGDEGRKVIAPRPDINDSACDVLEEPIVVCRASGTCVVPKDKQRK